MSAHAPSATSVVAAYFQPPQGYFWRWAEGNAVVEWLSGTTITYREELASLLTSLAPEGLPPLGAVLLLLAACNQAWAHNSSEIGLLQGLLRGLPQGGPPDEELTFRLSVARSFLDVVHELPAELRQGTAKEHLLRQVLGGNNTAHRLPLAQSQRLALDLAAYAETEPMLPEGQATRYQLRADLLCFDRAARQFPTVHGLELRLRTGLDQLPAPLPDPPAPPPSPEPPADLLAELATDTQTAGLARLVPHLRAALHLPQPARQAGDQPLGGVADLANRGPLDRLLLSELAQDELSLLARLAHGEALYLRREAPPLPQPLPRALLLDTTLHMWGLPRVMGLAAALALVPAASPGQPAALAFALGRRAAQPLDLRTRPGVVAALGYLDPALHCGAALAEALATLPAATEALLITEAQAARQPEFLAFLQAAPAGLRFLLTVARSGELVLHELAGGRRTVLSTSQVDAEALLFAPRRATRSVLPELVVEPAFLKQQPAPLFFPTVSLQPRSNQLHYEPKHGAVGVTQQLRVLYWPHSYHGALEALPMVEDGRYRLGFSGKQARTIYLLVTQAHNSETPLLILYTLKPWESRWERVDLLGSSPAGTTWSTIVYKEDTFILKEGHTAIILDCQHPEAFAQARPTFLAIPSLPAANPPQNHFNPGYGVLQKVNRLAISQEGYLLLDGFELVPTSDTQLTWRPVSSPQPGSCPAVAAGTSLLESGSRVRLRRWEWADGSEAVADARGLLHLRSADATLPQLTVVLATGRGTAAWAATGHKCGWSYFTRQTLPAVPDRPEILPVGEFYEQYVQPFLDRLR